MTAINEENTQTVAATYPIKGFLGCKLPNLGIVKFIAQKTSRLGQSSGHSIHWSCK